MKSVIPRLPLLHGICLASLLFLGPAEPVPAADLDLAVVGQWTAQSLAVSGDFAYLIERQSPSLPSDSALRVIDISNPSAPRLVTSLELERFYPGVRVMVSGQHAYVYGYVDADENGGGAMMVFDISDPLAPRQVGVLTRRWPVKGLAISGSHAYVAESPSGLPASEGRLEVLDVSDLTNLQSVGTCYTSLHAYAFHLLLRGDTGQVVRVERSRNLSDWETVATVPIPASGQTLIDPVATTAPYMFYRAVSVP